MREEYKRENRLLLVKRFVLVARLAEWLIARSL